ncbi:hypothetical protein [Paenibacillus hexagrammi]|uniref:Uncharacterized protein n=1 Tax=Paenibacillus hexagrammi TaxID=2908839 RepID=A0ABY3SMM4_9BACL|nr:hypothetical protein [Paenibacillus sp. YPD9-1]UJF35249.1 hypothetical protein L0M14_09095 [Paenibacillus sp. YPD9-1]
MSFFTRKKLVQAFMIILLIAGLLYFLFDTHAGNRILHGNMQQLSDYLRSLGIYGKLLGMALVILQTFFPFIPLFW